MRRQVFPWQTARLVGMGVVAALLLGGAGPAHAANDEQVTLTGYIPAPAGIFNRLVAEEFWDYDRAQGGDGLTYDRAVDWYVDPNGETRLRNVGITGGTPLLPEHPPREPAGTSVQLRMGDTATIAAEDMWVDSLGQWVSEIGDASSSTGGDGDWQIDGANNMYNLNSGQFVRIGPGPGYQEAALGAPPKAKTVDVNAELVVRSPNGITLGGKRKTAWPAFEVTKELTATTGRYKNRHGQIRVMCDTGYRVLSCGGRILDCGDSSDCGFRGTLVQGAPFPNECFAFCTSDQSEWIRCQAQVICGKVD